MKYSVGLCAEDLSLMDPYKRLACGIIIQAVRDYQNGHMSDGAFEHFCRSQWFQQLTAIDGEYLLKRCQHDRKRAKRRN